MNGESLQQKCMDLLRGWLLRRLDDDAAAWFEERIEKVAGSDRELYLAIGLAPRKLGKQDLELDATELAAAAAAREGWDPSGWSVDQAARTAFLLAAAIGMPADFPRLVEQLCRTADVRELIAIYQALPLYPTPEAFVARAAEGVRTNMKAVFEAVAHRNPYPAERFDELTWNQMVLKAVFVGSTLGPIAGFDRRRNVDLARTLSDYAHERWAASRVITPELWRAVGPWLDETLTADLRRVLENGTLPERRAAVLALRESDDPEAARLLADAGDAVSEVEENRVSWETVCRDIQKPQ